MPWVRFSQKFDYKPNKKISIAYKAGGKYLVKQDCAEKAIAAGKAVKINRRKTRDDAGR